MSPSRFRILALLYFASGAAALVDEVAFFKYLSLVFGATAYASSAVLVAFMGGLAIGAFGAASLERRIVRPLIAYGALEIAVGLACALAPAMFGLVTRAYVALAASFTTSPGGLALLRYALATLVVVMPAIGMGATLPLVVRVLGRDAIAARRVAALYALNTAGGAVGSLASAYAIIPALGLAGTMRASAAVSVVVGVVGAAIGRDLTSHASASTSASTNESAGDKHPTTTSVLVLAALASGLFVFASEVVFVHLLALVVGTSVYVFGLVLAIFLVSLSMGAALSRPLARRAPHSALAVSLALTALAVAAGIPLWESLPTVFVKAGPAVTSWAGREAIRALVSFAALAAPVTCMGMAFPLVLQSAAHRANAARVVGRVTGANTLASIVGSLVAGWLLVPLLGSQRSLVVVAIGYAVAALVVKRRPTSRRISTSIGLAAAAATLVALLAPRWDLTRIAGGTNVYFEKQLDDATHVVWVHEDVHGGVTTVTRARAGMEGEVTTLYTNGKFQGDDGFQMTAQFGFAHIPMLFVPRCGRALVIGLGTGTTLGQLGAYPFEHLDVAELSPGIVTAAGTFFGAINRGITRDPRVVIRFEDGRNVLLVGPRSETYDLVSIEISSIWFAGAANLYNREFYETASARLLDDGILQQWVQLHHTSRREIASQLATVRAIFPHVILFVRGEQGIVVASRRPLVAVRERLAVLDAVPRLRAELGAMHLEDYLADAVLADETLDRFVDEVARESRVARAKLVSTDDNLLLEYASPKNNVPGLPDTDETAAMLRAYRPGDIVARHLAR